MAGRKIEKGFAEEVARYDASAPRSAEPMTLPDGSVRHVLKLGAKGRVLLPSSVRAAMGLGDSETILGWLKDGKLTLEGQRGALKKIQQKNKRLSGGRSVVDELIAERRAAAARGK
ncbi:MAG: hypothetical protein NTV56_25335 [Alphaproteobacteria bacterium]|nr:hypothetical protein [Alphaproteobacteria bacterium]